MNDERGTVRFGDQIIEFAILRRPRRTLEIAVEPDLRVIVTAPVEATIEAIEGKVFNRAAWVRRQQRYFGQFLPRTPERRYLSGETHLYLGRRYRLKVRRRSTADPSP